jgi:hypothetical protein
MAAAGQHLEFTIAKKPLPKSTQVPLWFEQSIQIASHFLGTVETCLGVSPPGVAGMSESSAPGALLLEQLFDRGDHIGRAPRY